MYSLVISTIGCPFLLESLATLRYPPDDVIVVVDTVGRRASTLDRDYPMEDLSRDLQRFRTDWGLRTFVADTNKPWAVMNGCYNIGWRAARHPFVWFTHDDIEYPDFDFPSALRPVLQAIQAEPILVGRRRVTGLVLPEYEVINRVTVPEHPQGSWGLTQYVSPVSHVLSVEALKEMGGFDETDGIWYDGNLEAETRLRDWWYVLLPTPEILHTSNRTYQVNNWGDRWAANPIWGNYSQNFAKRYGAEWTRDLSPPLQPLSDPRYGLTV